MLTQEQADDLNLQLHAQEAAEIWLAQVNKELDGYYAALEKVSEVMQTATPEMMDRIRKVMPRLIEWYNNAKLKKSTYEDSYLQATNKINEYNILKAQQTSVATQPKRRVVKQGVDTTLPYGNWVEALMDNTGGINTQWWTKLQDGTLLSPDWKTTVSPNWQVSIRVGIEQTLPYSNWVNALMDNAGGINTQWWTKLQDGTLLSPDWKATVSPSWQVSMWVGIEQTLPYSNWINALYSNRKAGQTTPTFTPITTPLDSYRYQSKWYTPRYNWTYYYTNPTN